MITKQQLNFIFTIFLGILSYSAIAEDSPFPTPGTGKANLKFFVSQEATTATDPPLTFASGESKTVVLKNDGKADFTGDIQSALQIDPANVGFAQTNDCPVGANITLAVNASCTVTLTFMSQTTDVTEASLNLVLPSSGSLSIPKKVKLEGQGISSPPVDAPKLSVTPIVLNFDSDKTTDTVTVKNEGTGTLTISNIALSGTHASDFSQSGCENANLAAAGGCEITVTFSVPSDDTVRTASLDVSSNGGQSTVALTGQGKTLSSSTELPDLGQILAFDTLGNPVNTTAKFEGGISVNAGKPVQSAEMTLTDSVILSGVITPDPSHNAQNADIIVVGLYVPESQLETDNCDSERGDYYMMQKTPDSYCKGDKSFCKKERDKPQNAEDYSKVWISLWDGNLQKLEALYRDVSLAEPIKLTTEGKSKGLGSMYEGHFDARGHLCINMGYRLSDGTLVFNGKTIDVRIK